MLRINYLSKNWINQKIIKNITKYNILKFSIYFKNKKIKKIKDALSWTGM